MSWLFSRNKPRGEPLGPTRLESGHHRSPGLAALCAGLAERETTAILDFGPPSTQNLHFLSRFAERVQIQDLFRSCGGSYGERAEPYVFPEAATIALPEDGPYDAFLLWDLLHYFKRAQIPALVSRLAALARPGSQLLLIASAKVPVPRSPVQFKIADTGHLEYQVAGEACMAPPELTPREVEKLFQGFVPVRLFQLRNGLQELLFAYRGEVANQQQIEF